MTYCVYIISKSDQNNLFSFSDRETDFVDRWSGLLYILALLRIYLKCHFCWSTQEILKGLEKYTKAENLVRESFSK